MEAMEAVRIRIVVVDGAGRETRHLVPPRLERLAMWAAERGERTVARVCVDALRAYLEPDACRPVALVPDGAVGGGGRALAGVTWSRRPETGTPGARVADRARDYNAGAGMSERDGEADGGPEWGRGPRWRRPAGPGRDGAGSGGSGTVRVR